MNKAIVAVALKCFLQLPRQGNYVRLCQGCFYRCGQAFSCQARPLGCGKDFVFLGKKRKRLVKNGNLDGFVHLVIFFPDCAMRNPTKPPFGRIRCLELVPPALYFQLWKGFFRIAGKARPLPGHPKRKLVFQPSIVQVQAVSFREFKWSKNKWVSLVCAISTPPLSVWSVLKPNGLLGPKKPPPGGSTLEVTKWCQRNGGAPNM